MLLLRALGRVGLDYLPSAAWPPPAGMLARRCLAASVRELGGVVRDTLQLYTGPINDQGRLLAAKGVPVKGKAIDAGLFEAAWPIHQAAVRAGGSLQVAIAAADALHCTL